MRPERPSLNFANPPSTQRVISHPIADVRKESNFTCKTIIVLTSGLAIRLHGYLSRGRIIPRYRRRNSNQMVVSTAIIFP